MLVPFSWSRRFGSLEETKETKEKCKLAYITKGGHGSNIGVLARFYLLLYPSVLDRVE